MAETIPLRMAKASADDLKRVRRFFQAIEEAMETGQGQDSVGRLVREHWRGVDVAWERVLIGYAVLVDNCCDPNADTLEWRPDIEAAMKAAGLER